MPAFGRNDTVVLRRGDEVVTLKWKKAEPLVRYEGWTVESVVGGVAPVSEPTSGEGSDRA